MNNSLRLYFEKYFFSEFAARTNAIRCAMSVSMVCAFHRKYVSVTMAINGIPPKISAFQFVQQIVQMENVLPQIIAHVIMATGLQMNLTVHRFASQTVKMVFAWNPTIVNATLAIVLKKNLQVFANRFVSQVATTHQTA